MLIAPIPTAGPTPGNLWFAPLRSAKHAASNVSAEPGLAPVHSASTDSSTRSAPTAATRLTTAQGLVKWPSRQHKNPEERKDYHLRVPLTPGQRTLIERAARLDGEDKAGWARAVLLSAARRTIAKSKTENYELGATQHATRLDRRLHAKWQFSELSC